MDSGQWLQDKSLHKTAAVEINSTTDVQYWLNENEQLVGVCVNFELADDVHYELNTENWFRFLREALFIAPSSNCVVPFRDFLNTAAPQVDFGMVLDAKRIEYKKVAFHDCDIDDWDCVILTEELKPNSHDHWSWLFGELRRLFAMKAVFVKFHQACIYAFALRSTAHIHRIFPLWLPASSRIVRNAALFTVPIKIFFYHVDVNGQRFTASGITCAGQKKFSALALYQFHRSAAAWTFFACPHVAGKSVGVRFFVCIGVYGCALIRCSAHL